MKNFAINFLKGFFEQLFSFGSFMFIVGVLFILIMVTVIKNQNAEEALAEATTKTCYDGGLIKVDTDAGFYCVAPANLVKVKVN